MYCTDLEETQWQVIKKILTPQERKRKYDLRGIWNAIFYLVKTGCQWRMLPSNSAPWELVYYYYRKWCSLGEFDLLLNNLREKVRVKMGQKAEPSLGIMDSQSVRWGDNRSLNCFLYEFDLSTAQGPIKTIRFTIDEVYPGTKYDDTCISEIICNKS